MTDNTQYTDINRGNNDVTPEGVLAEQSEVLLDDSQRATGWHEDANQEWEEREARNELKHVAGLGELQDVTEVEYRKVRLERVVLVGVWPSAVTTQAKAEESLRELRRSPKPPVRWYAMVCCRIAPSRMQPRTLVPAKPRRLPTSWRVRKPIRLSWTTTCRRHSAVHWRTPPKSRWWIAPR